MSANKYFILSDSVSYLTKRFRVVQTGYKPVITKRQTIRETIGGGLDISQGSIYETHQYVVRLRETEEDSNYGTKADLEFFYRLINGNPTSGSPSDLLTITDHFGNVKYGYMTGNFAPEPMTTILDGTEAWFLIPVEFRILPS